MKLKFFKLADLDKNLKATVHRTGKMGFTFDAAKKLNLATMKSANIGANDEDHTDKNLYLVLYADEKQGDFKVIKAGKYFYINTKVLFDNLKIDYINETVSFDITQQEIEGQKVFAFKRRIKTKKTKEEIDDDFLN